MSEDYSKDSVTKTYGIRSGEPKRPESLIEMPGMVPEVPEVSLCFSQEQGQPLQTIRAPALEAAGNAFDHCHQRLQQNEVLQRNKYESYNTWKAKNAEALQAITGGLGGMDLGLKHAPVTKKSVGLVRKQSSGKEIYSPPINATKFSVNGNCAQVHSNQQKDSSSKSSQRHNDNHNQLQMPSSKQPGKYSIEYQGSEYPFPQYYEVRDCSADSQQNEELLKSSSSNSQNHYICKDGITDNTPCQTTEKSNHNGTSTACFTNLCNRLHCPCEKQKMPVHSSNRNQFVTEKPMLTAESRCNNMQFYSPLDSGLIYNHLSSLSHIINVQKEQISMLSQEVSNQRMLMTALLEEVKKIHTVISSNITNPHDTIPDEIKCQSCSWKHKNEGSRNDTSVSSVKGQFKQSNDSTSKRLPASYDVEKKSVGVMTSSLDNTDNPLLPSNVKSKSHMARNVAPKGKKQHKQSKTHNSPSPKKIKQPTNQKEEKRKSQSNSSHRRKNEKEESNTSSQGEDSFSLDEAAVVVRNQMEKDTVSPDVSIHVNMPDYSASSAESDTTSSEGDGQESGSDEETSDPNIGWTFYDRVVGQVNNMLKKTSSDPRQEYDNGQRKQGGNILYRCSGDYETENNWSKRVTFDGPPLEDSDNNGMHMPRYHPLRIDQDYRRLDGPERVQDFLMCDYPSGGNNLSMVNGSANVSFATYRYYQRHHLLPPPPQHAGVRLPEQMFMDPHQMKKKKSKARKNEKSPQMPTKSHKRRSGGPPSKILDMSSLKHQPKLF